MHASMEKVGRVPRRIWVRKWKAGVAEKGSDLDFLTLDMVDKFLAMALPIGNTKDHPFTYPMRLVAPPLCGLKLPPVMVEVAEKDLIHETQIEYCEAKKKAGKDIDMVISPRVSHSFYLNKIAIEMDPHVGEIV